jgi:small nuclear ribonucleoprotein (snRNP)-like protein
MISEMKNKLVVVTTKYRGTYVGTLHKSFPSKEQLVLKNARMIIYWGTTRGYQELAVDGPTATSKLAAEAPMAWVCGVTSVDLCSEKAVEAWAKVK